VRRVQVIAHRGASKISPENTMIAFRRAIEVGADAIETDVQLTKDGHLVLIHDERVNRTTNGTGWVKDYTLQQLRQLDTGSWFSKTYQGEKIPTIDEFFDLIRPTNMWINVEMKNGLVNYPGIEEKLIRKIREYQLTPRVVVSSFNHYSLLKFRHLAPDMNTAVLYMSAILEPWAYAKRIGANGIHPYKDLVTKRLIDQAHQFGMTVCPFTIDDQKEMKELINLGVDGIMSNVPDRLILLLQK